MLLDCCNISVKLQRNHEGINKPLENNYLKKFERNKKLLLMFCVLKLKNMFCLRFKI